MICVIERTELEFHFSLVVARLAGILVDGIKNRKAKEILGDSQNDLLDGFSELEISTKYAVTLADWRFFSLVDVRLAGNTASISVRAQ